MNKFENAKVLLNAEGTQMTLINMMNADMRSTIWTLPIYRFQCFRNHSRT